MTRFLFYVEHGSEEGITRGRLLANPPVATLLREEGSVGSSGPLRQHPTGNLTSHKE